MLFNPHFFYCTDRSTHEGVILGTLPSCFNPTIEKPIIVHQQLPKKMERSKLNLCFFISISLMLQTLVLCEPQVPCFFIFGDSLVDNGNNNIRNTTAKANFLPYGIDLPDGPTGRFTNGLNIADVIAELLGFDKYIPSFLNATNQEIVRGVNYGSGGSGILDETGRLLGDVISLNEQLSIHKTVIPRIAESLGSRLVARHHLRKCIYLVGMGNNDYLSNYLPQLYSSKSPYTPEEYATLLINQYSKQLRKLYRFGARKVSVFGLGSLGCIPQQLKTYGATDGSFCVETSNDAVLLFNEKLKLLIDKLNDQLAGATFLYTVSSSTSFGNITNLSDPCCMEWASTGDGLCLPETEVCSNRDEYMFWDLFHPTEAANLLSGKVAYTNMSPLYADLIDVW